MNADKHAARDTNVMTLLASVKDAQGNALTGRAAVLEVVRVAGLPTILLDGMSLTDLETDITAIQSAAAEIADPATRTTSASIAAVVTTPLWPLPTGQDRKQAYRVRAVRGGK